MLTIEKVSAISTAYSNWKVRPSIEDPNAVLWPFYRASKLAFFAKELAVAWQFGTSDLLDAFLIAYVVPSFAVNLIAGSMNSALIPTYIQAREREGHSTANTLYTSVMTLSLMFLMICTGLIILSAPYYLQILASGFEQQKLKLTINLLYVTSPVIVLSGISTVRGAVLNAVKSLQPRP
jgi:putative peptidoglycan lipid II flippase